MAIASRTFVERKYVLDQWVSLRSLCLTDFLLFYRGFWLGRLLWGKAMLFLTAGRQVGPTARGQSRREEKEKSFSRAL
jgi:hypothetical protein